MLSGSAASSAASNLLHIDTKNRPKVITGLMASWIQIHREEELLLVNEESKQSIKNKQLELLYIFHIHLSSSFCCCELLVCKDEHGMNAS